MRLWTSVVLAGVLLLASIGARAQSARQSPAWMDIARTPPMGWNSWNRFQCDVSDALIRQTADALVSTGMRDAGYRYVVIDDCWQVARDANGTIVPDPKRFPNGMKALADYVHSKGLRFGLYSDAGSKTCQGRPGSNGFETEDATQYAAWGVDYLKYDWCSTDGVDAKIAYTTMRDALRATGRPIVFSMCEWGTSKPWTWARGVGHLWRTTTDILPCWECTKSWGGLGWPSILDLQVGLDKYAGPGGWNDPDMLQVGNPGLTDGESRAHFSFWALLAAPLIAGNDVRSMTLEVRDILLNKEVIAIDQDPLGREGHKVRDDGDLEVWAKPLEGGAQAVILFNRGTAAAPIAVSWHELGWSDDSSLAVRDLWQHKDLGRVTGTFRATVPSHEVVMVKVAPPTQQPASTDFVAASDPMIVTTHAGTDAVEFTVTNKGPQSVTAWGATVEITLPDKTTLKMSEEKDGYAGYAGVYSGGIGAIPPGGSVKGHMLVAALAHRRPANIRVRIAMAVFTDRTAVGDADMIREIFEHRQQDYEATGFIIDALRAGLSASPGSNRLAVSLERLDAAGQAINATTLVQGVRGNLVRAMSRHEPGALSPASLLNMLLVTETKRRQAADEHRQRR